jgi:hypothetical protein
LVRIAFQSVVLSVPFSRGSTLTFAALRVFSTSFAMPSPYAVASSITATVFGFLFSARYCAIAGPCWSSRPTTRNWVLKPCSVSFGLVAEPEMTGMPAWL